MIVFAGPSVSSEMRVAFPNIDWRPPAQAGDFLAQIGNGVEKVLLIDGLFDERASIRHKEAMALMADGALLFGAASMGALRAAELHRHGMIPLGRIARAYCADQLVGDDEVALVHGNERIGWKAVSVAMVDVRATLCRALRNRLVNMEQARALRACWHAIHYVDRDWPAMIDAQQVVSQDIAEAIAKQAVEFKQLDAAEAIAEALNYRGSATRPVIPQTLFFDRLRAGA